MIKIYEMKSLDLEEIMALQKSPLLNVKKFSKGKGTKSPY